jgi:hypothetical protein
MSDITSAAAAGVGAAAGFVTLASLGIDPVAIGFGAAGAIAMQALLPRAEAPSLRNSMLVMLGSTLFAGGLGPAVSLMVGGSKIALQYHIAIAATLGMAAQPIALGLRYVVTQRAVPWLTRLGDRVFGASEEGSK